MDSVDNNSKHRGVSKPKITAGDASWSIGWSILGCVFVLAAIVLWGTSPIKDGDIWWQMAYGRYLVENKTLVPDHSVFTWSKTDNSDMYCAWISEISLYLLYKIGGLPILFIFKYFSLINFAFFSILYAKKFGIIRHPLSWAACMLGIMMSAHAGAFIKPEMFSYIFLTITAFIWIWIKSSGEKAWKVCYVFPAVMLVWVNSHGGYIFGLIFLGIMWFGEKMNSLFSPSQALPEKVQRHLFIAGIFTAVAWCITPYGLKFPPWIIKNLLSSNPDELATVYAYFSIFTKFGIELLYVDFFIVATAFLVVIIGYTIVRRQLDWAILLVNIFFAILFCRIMRTTYFWGVIFTFSSLYLIQKQPIGVWVRPVSLRARRLLGVITMIIALFLTGRSVYARTTLRSINYWLGFGNSYTNPVEEAGFIKQYLHDLKIGNDYDTGAYLLWELYPETKIMIDPRYFPFREWYTPYIRAFSGIETAKFVESMDCDVWCVSYLHPRAMDWFTNSPRWKPIFYGASAVVYLRHDLNVAEDEPLGGKGIEDLPVPSLSTKILGFAINVRDWDGAVRVFQGLRRNFPDSIHCNGAANYLKGFFSYQLRNYTDAVKMLEEARNRKVIWSDVILLQSYQLLTRDHWRENRDIEACRVAKKSYELGPKDLVSVYNYGVTSWYLGQGSSTNGAAPPADGQSQDTKPQWRELLELYLQSGKGNAKIPVQSITIVEGILKGQVTGRPPVLFPNEPSTNLKNEFETLLKRIE